MFSPDSIRSMSDLAMFAKGRSDFMHDKVLKDLNYKQFDGTSYLVLLYPLCAEGAGT